MYCFENRPSYDVNKVGRTFFLHFYRSNNTLGHKMYTRLTFPNVYQCDLPNPKSLTGDKVDSGIGLRSTLAYWVAHGKCVGVDSGVDIR